jgi:hypothetical protein
MFRQLTNLRYFFIYAFGVQKSLYKKAVLAVFFVLPYLLVAQTENCINGTDDDADGLIDCYDQDCTCTGQCEDFYYTTCNADCYYVPPCNNISLGVQWQATAETGTYSVLVAGDMDGDDIPDIVTYWVEHSDIYIIDGKTGATKLHINGPTDYPGGTAPAIADLDHDGLGEFVLVGNDRILRCWEHDGTLKFASTVQVGYADRYRFSVPNIADFDHNGWAEINIGNQVFNGQTGALLAEGGSALSAGEHPARKASGFSFNSTVPIDVLSDSFCPDCDGLEIVAGNQVMSVNLQTGVVAAVVTAEPNFTDGFTSVADFDKDGDLDAIVQGKKGALNYVYVWEIETPTVIRQFKLFNNWNEGASRVNVADLNGDGNLEISFVGYPWLYALKNNFTTLWTRPTNDYSSVTASSVFDFCGDGSADVVYRGQTHLQILEGANGAIKWQDECMSATHIENPLILDVDNDGQTEVVISCGTDGTQDVGTIFAYEAVGAPGIASRPVWNQHGYFNVNINDDLSVPTYQQNHHKVGNGLQLNTFMNQYFNPTFPSPDANLTIGAVVCNMDSLEIEVNICNTGDNILPANTPISVYKKNPQAIGSTWVQSVQLGTVLLTDSCRIMTVKMPRIANDSIFLVLNDNHSKPTPYKLSVDFPVTTIGECQFENNIAGFIYNYNPGILQLGADTIVCDNATVLMTATGMDFEAWIWNNGSTLPTQIAPDAGTYSVTVTDVCGITRTDIRKVSIDSSTVVTLGADRTMCKGETLTFGETGFDFYTWKPAVAVACASCPMAVVGMPNSGYVTLEAGFANGCRSMDSVYVTVYDTFNYKIDTTICFGRSVMWNGEEIFPNESRTFFLQTIHGCDSTVQVRVIGTTVGTYQIQVDTAVCQGKFLPINGIVLPPDSTHTFYLSAIGGCDSTVVLEIMHKDTFSTQEDIVICAGDDITIFGTNYSNTGLYQRTFLAQNGCDSTHHVNLTVLEVIDLEVDGTPTCLNESTGTLTALATGGGGDFTFVWSVPDERGTVVEDLPAGTYSVTTTDANNCTEIAVGVVPSFPQIVFSAETDSVRCFGETNGAISVTAADSTLVFSLDDAVWTQNKEFKNIGANDYILQAQDIHGCIESLNVPVYQPDELLIALPADATIALGDSLPLKLQSTSTDSLSYRWSRDKFLSCPTCETPISTPFHTIKYDLTVTDPRGCTASDDITIVVERIIGVYVPNAIAPLSANDVNEKLLPLFGPAVKSIKYFRVYDRWGTLLHQIEDKLPNNPADAWEAKYHNKALPSGVYPWRMEVELVDGAVESYSGDVTVVR